MDIPINAEVLCAGELCGRSRSLIINPINERITHLVVAEKAFPHIERLVPIAKVLATSQDSIQLRCKPAEFSNLKSYEETDFLEAGQLESVLPYELPYQVWPYAMYTAEPIPVERERLPVGEVEIRRGTPVKATDGAVGKVDEFLVDPHNEHITHLILREGHLWGKKDVTIPVAMIDQISDEAVLLKLDKKAIASLPTVPLRRKWK